MTNTVFSGTLNSTIPYHTIPYQRYVYIARLMGPVCLISQPGPVWRASPPLPGTLARDLMTRHAARELISLLTRGVQLAVNTHNKSLTQSMTYVAAAAVYTTTLTTLLQQLGLLVSLPPCPGIIITVIARYKLRCTDNHPNVTQQPPTNTHYPLVAANACTVR